MIMPLDIQNKQFTKGVRGYREDEVDQFLDMITVDMEKLLESNRLLKSKIKDLQDDLERKKSVEDKLEKTLTSAQNMMKEIAESAEKRAEMVMKNAEIDAQLIINEAKETSERYKYEMKHLEKRYTEFNIRFKSLLEAELNKFDAIQRDIIFNAREKESDDSKDEFPSDPTVGTK